jgi:hypothetical protein
MYRPLCQKALSAEHHRLCAARCMAVWGQVEGAAASNDPSIIGERVPLHWSLWVHVWMILRDLDLIRVTVQVSTRFGVQQGFRTALAARQTTQHAAGQIQP